MVDLHSEIAKEVGNWKTLDSGGDYTTIDFSVSENLDEEGNPLAVLQIYHSQLENKEDQELGGVIYLKEEQLFELIQNLISTHLEMDKVNKLLEMMKEN